MLDSYLSRIGYQGPKLPTLQVLRDVHRQHLLNIPYENIDVLLQRPVNREIKQVHQKLVTDRRGGWCYEMNGLLGWALTQMGFQVTQLSGGVMREERGDTTYGNHLLLRIDFDAKDATPTAWLADTGLGDGLLEPIPLKSGSYQQQATFSLVTLNEPTTAQTWRFINREGGMPASFDFIDQPADQAILNSSCLDLQQDPASTFRQNLVVQRVSNEGTHSLIGRFYTAPGRQRDFIESEAALAALLTTTFAINQPPMDGLWDSICKRHLELFGDA